jgi:hypothetical protein
MDLSRGLGDVYKRQGVIDNFYVPRLDGTIRWIAEDRVNQLVLVRPRR